MNVNIIAGPNEHQYWNHSKGASEPLVEEEGPFPIQGNIGHLLFNEKLKYELCDNTIPIGGGPNCVGTFVEDIYTKKDSCGSNCKLKYPESYGLQDFGFKDDSSKYTNSHQLHAYTNERANFIGQGPYELGSYEWVPRITSDKNSNTGILDQNSAYSQVGEWNKLPQYKNLQYSSFNTR